MAVGGYRYVIVGPGRRAACWPAGCPPTLRAGWHCWRRAGRTGSGRSASRWRPAAVPDRLRLELPHQQAAAAVGPGAVLAARQDPRRFVIDQRPGLGARAPPRLRRRGATLPGLVLRRGAGVLPAGRAPRGQQRRRGVRHLRPALHLRGVQPRHELVGVGANLQDHLAWAVIVHCPKPIKLLAAESPAQLARFLLAHRHDR
jgi:hypothetical protein